jgi:hypothetical protein
LEQYDTGVAARLGAAAALAHNHFMIIEALTLLAETMDRAIGRRVAVADLARQSSSSDLVLLTLVGQELSYGSRDQPTRRESLQPQQVSLAVLAGCYFEEYSESLAALDAVWAFVYDTPLLPHSGREERARVHLLSPRPTEVAAYWSALRKPMMPSLFLQVLTVRASSTVVRDEIPVL